MASQRLSSHPKSQTMNTGQTAFLTCETNQEEYLELIGNRQSAIERASLGAGAELVALELQVEATTREAEFARGAGDVAAMFA